MIRRWELYWREVMAWHSTHSYSVPHNCVWGNHICKLIFKSFFDFSSFFLKHFMDQDHGLLLMTRYFPPSTSSLNNGRTFYSLTPKA